MRRSRLFHAVVVIGCSLGAAACDNEVSGEDALSGTPTYGKGHPGSLARTDGDASEAGDPHAGHGAGAQDASASGGASGDGYNRATGDGSGAGDAREAVDAVLDGEPGEEDGWQPTK